MILEEVYKLNNGVRIPKLALGTWMMSDEEAESAVYGAVDAGYRHIDTAVAYENEAGVGRGLRKALADFGIHRESIFLTSKIPAEVKDYKAAVGCIQESYERLGTEHVDLMLIHAPRPWNEMGGNGGEGCPKNYFAENLEVWKAMEEAYEWKKYRAIGVSNFSVDDLKNILDNGSVKPVVNQIKVHIGHVPMDVIEFCKENGILVEAYSPNAHGSLGKIPEVCTMAEKYGVSVPQLASRFDLQLGLLPLPKSTHLDRIRKNAELDFEISESDMAALVALPVKC